MNKSKGMLAWVWAFLVLAIFLGAILNTQMGEHFVLFSPDWRHMARSAAIVLVFPAALLALWVAPPFRSAKEFLVIPFAAIFIAAAAAFAPLGYIYLWGYLAGEEVMSIKANASLLDPLHNAGRGCRQKLSLTLDGKYENVCVDGRLIGPVPRAGQALQIRGVVSSVGIWVKEVRTN